MAVGVRSLAKLLERSPSTVSEWIRRPDWTFGAGPWTDQQVIEIAKWSAELEPRKPEGAKPSAASVGMSELKRLLTAEKWRRERIARLADEQKLHDAEKCRQHRLRQFHMIRTELEAIPDGLPVDMQTQQMVADAIRDALNRLIGVNDTRGNDRTTGGGRVGSPRAVRRAGASGAAARRKTAAVRVVRKVPRPDEAAEPEQ